MSKIEVNQIDTISGSSTLLVGPSAATKLTFSSTLTVDFNVNSPGVTLGVDMKNTPAFKARLSSNQSITNDTFTKVQWDSEQFDTDTAYDNITNYRFTVPSGKAGKYFFHAMCCIDDCDDTKRADLAFYLNGSIDNYTTRQLFSAGTNRLVTVQSTVTYELSVGDYIEVYARQNDGTTKNIVGGERNVFQGYKLIGA